MEDGSEDGSDEGSDDGSDEGSDDGEPEVVWTSIARHRRIRRNDCMVDGDLVK